MRTRRFLAAAVLAALTLYSGGLEVPPPQATTDEESAQVINGPGTARFLLASGYDLRTAWRIAGQLTGGRFSLRVRVTL